jgi:hypothetical protein
MAQFAFERFFTCPLLKTLGCPHGKSFKGFSCDVQETQFTSIVFLCLFSNFEMRLIDKIFLPIFQSHKQGFV